MSIKTFTAPSMPQALALVKKELGVNAVILHTRTLKTGGFLGWHSRSLVEITARPADAAHSAPAHRHTHAHHRLKTAYEAGKITPQVSDRKPAARLEAEPAAGTAVLPGREAEGSAELKREIGNIRSLVENLVKEQRQLHAPQMPEQLFDMYLGLIQREVADEIAREMIAQTQQDLTGNQMQSIHVVRRRLLDVMENMISTTGPVRPNLNGSARVIALIGPTGVGKTTTIAKLAANFKLRQNKKVGLITIDTYRIGAVDQLRMYAQIIDVPLKVVLTPAELAQAVDWMRDMDYIFIDTAGRCQKDELKLQELQTFLDAAKPDEVHLVLSGTASQSTMISAAERFKKLGVDRLILTKLDEAIGFGVVLSVLRKIDASISYITTGQDVPDDIEVGNGRKLAQMLLGIEEKALDAPTREYCA